MENYKEKFLNLEIAIFNDVDAQDLNAILKKFISNPTLAWGSSKFYFYKKRTKDWTAFDYEISLIKKSINIKIVNASEILKSFEESNSSNDSRFPFKLEEKDAKRILNIACSTWKKELIEKWSIILLQGYVIIKESFYKKMREACTDKQHELFDEIFGKEEELKVGDWVIVNNDFLKRYDLEKTFTNKTVQIIESTISTPKYYLNVSIPYNKSGGLNVPETYLRKATPEEIAKAQCPYEDGELCWVRDTKLEPWKLRYATGNTFYKKPTFYADQHKSGSENTWEHHKSAKGVELPKD